MSASDEAKADHKRRISAYLLEMCSVVAGVIRQETFDMVRQVAMESTSIGETKIKCTSSTDKIQAELAVSRQLLADMQLSLDSFTKLKTPQSDLRDQRVLECEEAWMPSPRNIVFRKATQPVWFSAIRRNLFYVKT